MRKKTFEVWFETLKKHVNKIERHQEMPRETVKFIFESALDHLILGWALVREKPPSFPSFVGTEILGRFSNQQEAVNELMAARIKKDQIDLPVLTWWKAPDRFEKFVHFTARLLIMSTKAPFETIFDKLAIELKLGAKGKRISKSVAKKGHDARHFAEAVALLVDSDLKNVTRDDIWDENNLSILLGEVEKKLRHANFLPGTLYDPAKPEPKKKSREKKTSVAK